jgi:hypothetical protein
VSSGDIRIEACQQNDFQPSLAHYAESYLRDSEIKKHARI